MSSILAYVNAIDFFEETSTYSRVRFRPVDEPEDEIRFQYWMENLETDKMIFVATGKNAIEALQNLYKLHPPTYHGQIRDTIRDLNAFRQKLNNNLPYCPPSKGYIIHATNNRANVTVYPYDDSSVKNEYHKILYKIEQGGVLGEIGFAWDEAEARAMFR